MDGLFVAGTDTGAGKTFVAAALCRALRRAGIDVAGVKPFETGCDPNPADAEALEAEAHSGLPIDLRCPWRFRTPVAPAAAAARERPAIARGTMFRAALAVARRAARERFAIVEAAGGLLVPIDGARTNLDLAAALGLPVLLVGKNALGTLNHCALSVEALRRRRVPILGLVLSRGLLPADASQRTNAEWARRMCRVPVIELPRTTTGRAAATLSRAFLADLPAIVRRGKRLPEEGEEARGRSRPPALRASAEPRSPRRERCPGGQPDRQSAGGNGRAGVSR